MVDNRPRTGPNIGVQGSRPPTRTGPTPSASMHSKSGKRTPSQVNGALASASMVLRDALQKQLLLTFKDYATDQKDKEIIANEIDKFMSEDSVNKEEDISLLEERIKLKLLGGEPDKTVKIKERRANQQADQWGKIWQFEAEKNKKILQKEVEKKIKAKSDLRVWLDKQIEERKQKKANEQLEKQEEYKEVCRQWEKIDQEEKEKQEIQAQKIKQLKGERKQQLEDRLSRRQQAEQLKADEETELLRKIAYESKEAWEKDMKAREEAKIALKNYLLQNEVNKQIKSQKLKEIQEQEVKYMKEYEALLDRLEQRRQEQMAKVEAIQKKQQGMVKSFAPSKRWIDESLIEKQFKEREEALAKDEKQRQQIEVSRKQEVVKYLNTQLQEKSTLQKIEDEKQNKWAEDMIAQMKALEEKEKTLMQKKLEQKAQIRQALEDQMRFNAQHKRVDSMSGIEKQINKKLLERVDDFFQTGQMNEL